MAFDLVFGAHLARLLASGEVADEAFATQVVKVVLEGLRTDPGRSPDPSGG